jgi:tetratricopeptide (TPR) repeat protein
MLKSSALRAHSKKCEAVFGLKCALKQKRESQFRFNLNEIGSKVSLFAVMWTLGLTISGGTGHAATKDVTYDSSYGQYLIGKMAALDGDVQTAARAFMMAADAEPENKALTEKAFFAATLSGDMAYASRNIPKGEGTTRFGRLMGHEVQAISFIRARKYNQALKAIDDALKLEGDDRSAQLLRPLILAQAGKWEKAIDKGLMAELNNPNAGRDRLVIFLQAANQARLLELKGKKSEAEALYRLICQPGAASVLFGPYFGAFLERQSRKDEAAKIYESLLASSEDRLVRQRLDSLSLSSYKAPPRPDINQIMADSLLLSATLYASENQTEMALATLRLSQYVAVPKTENAPSRERTQLLVGQVLMKMRDFEGAQMVWTSIPKTSVYYSEAQFRAAWNLKEHEDLDGALKVFTALSEQNPKDANLITERARILWQQKDPKSALTLIEAFKTREGEDRLNWQLWFIKAIIEQDMGAVEASDASARAGLKLAPDSPELLNMLGYSLIDRNIEVETGIEMIKKALNISPQSGAIMDSLGWGYYRLGRFTEALEWIERAIEAEPSDPEITEHLGDVYKALGRDIEAKYQWARVLVLKPSEKQALSVTKKLDAAKKREALQVAEAGLKASTSVKKPKKK